MTDTSHLTKTYVNEIAERLQKTIKDITAREESVRRGREIPDEDSLILGKGSQLNAAIMFLDICGFSGWKSGIFEEQRIVLQVFNLYMTEMMKICQDYGGTVEKNTGDGLMAYFSGEGENAPQKSCDASIAAALTMFYVTTNGINQVLLKSGLWAVDFRIGIDYGPVTFAKVGSPRQFNSIVAIGSTANIANKILQHASRNEIVIGDMVFKNINPTWRQYCTFLTSQTGFKYVSTGQSYSYYRYTGRWTDPI